MSGSRPESAASGFAEQHLGDRLSALVDGELGHEARERVLAHVATCLKCRTEVEAQRRLKNVFAETAPPPPSASFLARLQGLPGGGDGGSPLDDAGFPALPGRSSQDSGASGVFGVRRERFEFGYVPAQPHPHRPDAAEGFRVHPVGRPDGERSASRGLRFAFVAAGAVSLAAVALGGVTTGAVGDTAAEARGGSGAGSNVTPARTAAGGAGAVTWPEAARRRQPAGPVSAQGQRSSSGTAPLVPTSLSAPLLPGARPSAAGQQSAGDRAMTTPVLTGAAMLSPLIRPLGARPPISLTGWSAEAGFTPPGLLAAPAATPAPDPSGSAAARTAH
ncbi:anti-sigma factor family protein [Streptomyces similanensis]|uniref:Zf-HC2 domain-containing protein n=1 Tax=Streptomyces similanensis TaxID=1274988 RepID=A0ABP9JU16_9ACTN